MGTLFRVSRAVSPQRKITQKTIMAEPAEDPAKAKEALNNTLKEYIAEWKKTKEKQAKRKEIRAEQEKKLNQQKKEEEEKLRKDEAEKKKRLEEAEAKRQAMLE